MDPLNTNAALTVTDELLGELSALRRFAGRLTRDEHAAADLVQETLLRAWRSLHTYQAGSNCRAWLFQICRNIQINEMRRRKLQPVRTGYTDSDADTVTGALTSQPQAWETDIASRAQERGVGDEVHNALGRLPAEYRTAVLLSDVEGLTYEEIAEFTKSPIGTVRSRIHRGRRHLAKSLERYVRTTGSVRPRRAA